MTDSSGSGDENVEREMAKHPRRTVAVAILVDAANRILLVRTKRLPNHWQPIGGGVRASDDGPLGAVLREVAEETGLSLDRADVKYLITVPYDLGEGEVHFFWARIGDPSVLVFDYGELEESRWLTLDQGSRLPMFPATQKCIAHVSENSQILES